ncbi:gustatory receptor 167 [Tribolium castaneum]|uniref:Gustatory receptor n=1 Tax=Tribolium castaneum TaxID=7070 RepID=D6WB86_TRICA|nr:gustatory receptor 167 [Tribolium castaneum]
MPKIKPRIYLYKAVQPVFLISKLAGLSTISFDEKSGYVKTQLGFVWSLFVFTLYISCIVFYLLNYKVTTGEKQWILHAIGRLNTNIRIITLVVLSLVMIKSGQKIVTIFTQIKKIDKKFETSNINLEYSPRFRSTIKFAVFCQMIHYILYMILQWKYLPKTTSFTYIIATTGATLNSGIVVHQFVVVLSLLKQRFQGFNQSFSQQITKNYHRHEQKSILVRLNSYYKLHKKLCNLTMMVEKTYATANLIILLKCLVSLTTAIHFVMDTHFIHPIKEKILIDQVKYLASISTNIFYILTLTLFCSKTAQEANKLAALQLQFPIKSNLIGLRVNIKIKILLNWGEFQIRNFILQSKHEKVAITCFNIVAAIATSSIIIIQFGTTKSNTP